MSRNGCTYLPKLNINLNCLFSCSLHSGRTLFTFIVTTTQIHPTSNDIQIFSKNVSNSSMNWEAFTNKLMHLTLSVHDLKPYHVISWMLFSSHKHPYNISFWQCPSTPPQWPLFYKPHCSAWVVVLRCDDITFQVNKYWNDYSFVWFLSKCQQEEVDCWAVMEVEEIPNIHENMPVTWYRQGKV